MADEDSAEVLDTVRAFFVERPTPLDSLHGPLREWTAQLKTVFPADAFIYDARVDEVELAELKPTSAVVRVRARDVITTKVTAKKTIAVYDGPVLLEKVCGRWLIVDFCSDGRQRLDGLILGHQAEQHRGGVSIHVVGIDRTGTGTPCLVEIENGSAVEVAPSRAFARAGYRWRPVWIGPLEVVEPGRSRRVLLTAMPLPRRRTELPLALELVQGGGLRLPFVLRVPLDRREQPVAEPAPKRLPLSIYGDRFLLVFYWAALSAVLLWQLGWPAVAVPLTFFFYYGSSFRRRRARQDR
jgi:hypothetical protein